MGRQYWAAVATLVTVTVTAATLPRGRRSAETIDVLMQHNDPERSGANTRETILTVHNVGGGRFGRLVKRELDGNPYGQPLVVDGARFDGRPSPTTVVVVATAHNSVYAFDAQADDSQSAKALLWHTGPEVFGPPVPVDELSQALAGSPHACIDMTPEVGITGTPAITTIGSVPREGVVFTVAKSRRDRRDYTYRLFALRLADGRPLSAGTAIEGEVAGDGNGSVLTALGRRVRFDPVIHLNRPALLVRDHVLFVSFGSHCDKQSYHGWLFAYDVSDPAAPRLIDVFCTTPNSRGRQAGAGAIWMSGQGPAMNEAGHLFFSTGDGAYDGRTEFGNTVVRLALDRGRFRVVDWFTPAYHARLTRRDADLGSSGVLLIPHLGLLVTGSKEGRLFLIDANKMGRLADDSLHSVQVTNAPFPPGDPKSFWNIHGAPVMFRGSETTFVYVWGEEDRLRQYRLEPDENGRWRLQPVAASNEFTPYPDPPVGRFQEERLRANSVWMPGAVLSVSSNGDRADTGIVWAAMGRTGNANHTAVPGVLRAYQATDVSRRLWESTGSVEDDPGMFAKFTPPTIAGGRVFLATFQGDQPAALVVYGLRPEPARTP